MVSVAYHPTVDVIATASSDNSIKLWDAKSYACIATYVGHSAVIRSIAFSPHESVVASAGADKVVVFWDVDQHLKTRLKHLE